MEGEMETATMLNPNEGEPNDEQLWGSCGLMVRELESQGCRFNAHFTPYHFFPPYVAEVIVSKATYSYTAPETVTNTL